MNRGQRITNRIRTDIKKVLIELIHEKIIRK